MHNTRTTVLISTAVAAVTALVVGVSSVAVASHQWNDVADGDFFHDAITNFSDAGCASGFPDGTFRGDEPVKRQQMARFINACGGRVEMAEANNVNLNTSSVNPTFDAALTITTGALGGGGGFVLLLADFELSTPSTIGTAVCTANFDIKRTGGVRIENRTRVEFNSHGLGNGSAMALVTLGSGVSVGYSLTAYIVDNCPTTYTASGTLTALYVPFRGDGTGA